MRFTPDFLDEIRARLPVSEVVGQRVKLRKQGREWAGLSPFNKEKTPSFFVNDQKGFYHCFSSGKHGDIFKFLMETEGIGFPDAVERLAAMAGLQLPAQQPRDVERERHRASLTEVMELAATFFEAELAGPRGGPARSYLERRDLLPETRRSFRMGYAPNDRGALKRHLLERGVPVEDQVEAGLLIAAEDIREPYDRFRDRVMFPIHDARGRVIAFGGRAMSSDVAAKYLNSPETPLFHKGGVLFNHHRARGPAHEAGTVIAVEGYVDVIALAQAGIPHAVAPLGTALTPDQLELMWKMAPEPILCFDGDKAGQRAAFRAVDVALPALKPGRSLRFAFLPQGQDPDDLIRASGRAAMEAVLARAVPLVDVLWSREAELQSLDTPERRAALESRLGALVQQIADENVRKYYRAAVFERLSGFAPLPEDRPRRGGGRGAPRGSRMAGGPRRFAPEAVPRASASLKNSPLIAGRPVSSREAAILMCLVNHPMLLDRHAETLAVLDMGSPELDTLRRAALDAASHGEANTVAEVQGAIARAGLAAALERAMAAMPRGTWWAQAEADDFDAEIGLMHVLALHHKASTLHKELRAAEAAFALDPSEENSDRLIDLRRQVLTVEGTEALIEGFGAASGRGGKGL